jgi:hypothetical protein
MEMDNDMDGFGYLIFGSYGLGIMTFVTGVFGMVLVMKLVACTTHGWGALDVAFGRHISLAIRLDGCIAFD